MACANDHGLNRGRARAAYIAAALATIMAGLWVHRAGSVLNRTARDVLGDALWAAMMVWWVSAIAPQAKLLSRALVAFGICLAVELSQLIHTPAIDEVRGTTFGQLVLGSGFDTRDLAAYAGGIAMMALLERALVRRERARGIG